MTTLDWSVVVAYLALSLGIGFFFQKRAAKNLENFFLSDRSLPWWLLGTSMVATTFASDTPLAITKLVAEQGIAGNWFWWSLALSGSLATFFFAKLWRRASLLTDIELIELRYGGKAAAWLRGFQAIYFGFFQNVLTIAWVLLAVGKIFQAVAGWSPIFSVVIGVIVALIYTVLSGFWGVVVTDLFQFIIAMGGSLLLAVFSVQAVGGLAMIPIKLQEIHGEAGVKLLDFFLPTHPTVAPWLVFLVYLTLRWWAGPEIDGSGYIAQRMLATKNEKHSVWASLLFNTAHFCLRPWPWILAALASVILYPTLADKEMGYPMLVRDLLPTGLRGLMVTSFLAAFMSTLDTQLNWGSSYLVNDFYKRFIKPTESARHYVQVARFFELLLAGAGCLLAFQLTSIVSAWELSATLAASIGLVRLLRWYWWRINVYSEIVAMLASGLLGIALHFWTDIDFIRRLLIIIPVTNLIWIVATLSTSPVQPEQLLKFLDRVKPASLLWRKFLKRVPGGKNYKSSDSFARSFINFLSFTTVIYATLFLIGSLLFFRWKLLVVCTTLLILSGSLLYRGLKKEIA